MTRLSLNLMIATAALAAVAGSAAAQNLKADVPFTFRAGGKVMAAGTYDVRVEQGAVSQRVILRNRETRGSVLLALFTRSDVPQAWKAAGNPKLSFECAGSKCILRNLWAGSGDSMIDLPGPRFDRGEYARVTEIPASRKAD